MVTTGRVVAAEADSKSLFTNRGSIVDPKRQKKNCDTAKLAASAKRAATTSKGIVTAGRLRTCYKYKNNWARNVFVVALLLRSLSR